MELIPFDCFNPDTNAELTFYVNPDKVVSVSGGVLPGELAGPDGKALPIEASVIILLNGQVLNIKDKVKNVIEKLEGGE